MLPALLSKSLFHMISSFNLQYQRRLAVSHWLGHVQLADGVFDRQQCPQLGLAMSISFAAFLLAIVECRYRFFFAVSDLTRCSTRLAAESVYRPEPAMGTPSLEARGLTTFT